MRHLSLECRFEAWFSRFQNANTKVKCLYQFKCIGKWFLCPKCGIYHLNAASKHDFLISECKYKGKMQMHRQMHTKMVFMPLMRHLSLECRFEAYFLDFRMQIQRQMLIPIQMRFQNAYTKANAKAKANE